MSCRYLEADKVTLPSRAPLFVEVGHCQWCNKELTGKATRYCRGSENYVYGDGDGNNLYSECATSFLNWWCSRPAYVRATFIKNNFTCQNCGLHPMREDKPWLPDISKLEADHIIPLAKSGETIMKNLQTLCKACNRKKGASLPNGQQANSQRAVESLESRMEPLCGRQWLEDNKDRIYPEQRIVVFFNGKPLVDMPSTAKKPSLIKAAMKMAVRSEAYAGKTV
jgi:5-methylcytosine-specific restriction endonuclease McrA